MGATTSGKTSLIVTMAEYVYETFGMITRLYSIDGGGFPTQMQAAINAGIVQVWRVRTRSGQGLAFETCQRVSQGYWPRRINPKTGETDPNVQLVPPVTQRFKMFCPNGHLLRDVPTAMLLAPIVCAQCTNLLVNPTNMVVQQESYRTKGFENIGAIAIDSATSMGGWMMIDLSHRTDLGGEKGNMANVNSGDMVWSANNRAQFGFVQNRIEELVHNSLSIPGLVVPPLWTALTNDATDEGGLSIRGPAIAPGQAKNGVAPQWFGNCLEITSEVRDNVKYRQMRLHEYIDKQGVRHLCKVRAYPGTMPAIMEDIDAPDQPAFVNFNLGAFYKLLKQSQAATEKGYAARFESVPGTPDGIVEFGEPNDVRAVPAAAPASPRAVGPRPTPKAPVQAAKPAAAAPAPSVPPPATAAPAVASTAPVPATTGVAAGAPVTPPKPVQAAAKPSTTPVTAKAPSAPAPAAARPAAAAPPAPASAPKAPVATPAAARPTASPSPAATGPRPAAPPASPGPARGPAAPPGRRPAPPAAPVKP